MEPLLQWWDRRNQRWADEQIAATRKVIAGQYRPPVPERFAVWPLVEFATFPLLPLSSRAFDGRIRSLALAMAAANGFVAVLLSIRHRVADRNPEGRPATRAAPRRRWLAGSPVLLCSTFVLRLAWRRHPHDLILPWAVLGLVVSASLSVFLLVPSVSAD